MQSQTHHPFLKLTNSTEIKNIFLVNLLNSTAVSVLKSSQTLETNSVRQTVPHINNCTRKEIYSDLASDGNKTKMIRPGPRI